MSRISGVLAVGPAGLLVAPACAQSQESAFSSTATDFACGASVPKIVGAVTPLAEEARDRSFRR